MMPTEVSPKDAAPESTRGARLASALAVRRLFKGVLLYSSANFGSTAIGFVTIMVLTRALSPSDFGIVALAETTAALVGTIGAVGLPIAYSRLAFRSRSSSN